jgi:hypothetical protein
VLELAKQERNTENKCVQMLRSQPDHGPRCATAPLNRQIDYGVRDGQSTSRPDPSQLVTSSDFGVLKAQTSGAHLPLHSWDKERPVPEHEPHRSEKH